MVVLFAVTGILAPFLSLGAPSLVFWRTLIAAAAMGGWLALRSPSVLRLGARDTAKAHGIGCIIGLHWICFFGSIELSNVSVALAGFATTSFFTAFTEPLICRRPVRPYEILLGLFVVLGILLIVGAERGYLPGLALGIFGASLAAIFPVLNHRLVTRGLSSRPLLAYEMAGACLVAGTFIALVPASRFQVPIASDWLPLLTLALLCTVLAHTLHIHLLRHLSAFTTNLVINFEPVYGILMAAAVFHEYEDLHPGFYLGVLTMVAANILQPVFERNRRARAQTMEPNPP